MSIDRRETFHSVVLGATITASNTNVRQYLDHEMASGLAALVDAQATILSYADATLVTVPKKAGRAVEVAE